MGTQTGKVLRGRVPSIHEPMGSIPSTEKSKGDNIIGSLVEALKGSPKGGLKSSMWEGFALNRNQKTSAPNAYLTGEKLKC